MLADLHLPLACGSLLRLADAPLSCCIGAIWELPGALKQVLAWMQPYLTDQFIKLAFHPDTFRAQPDLVERERAWSNQNPPYMFRAFHMQALTLFRSAAEYATWLRGIQVPVLVTAGDKDLLTPMVSLSSFDLHHISSSRRQRVPPKGTPREATRVYVDAVWGGYLCHEHVQHC